MRLSKAVTLFLLSLWIGGAMTFATVVAPTLFNADVLPDRTLAGSVVGAVLKRLFVVSTDVLALTSIVSLLGWLADRRRPTPMGILLALSAILTGASIGEEALRRDMVRINIEQRNQPDDASAAVWHAKFMTRHRLSTSIYSGALILALVGVAYGASHGAQPVRLRRRPQKAPVES
ncbi:MAG: DUF4149 domain-containing protein [Verrucomicrobiae bacterium]|nr:DUF4149 domain-containing protein [Verrucomicrobiae bacterium]